MNTILTISQANVLLKDSLEKSPAFKRLKELIIEDEQIKDNVKPSKTIQRNTSKAQADYNYFVTKQINNMQSENKIDIDTTANIANIVGDFMDMLCSIGIKESDLNELIEKLSDIAKQNTPMEAQ